MVQNRETHEFMGYLTDLTEEGMLVESTSPIPGNETFDMEIVILGEKIHVSCHSRWRDKDPHTELFQTGFRFDSVSQTDRKKIKSLIEVLKR